jgi:hypothetical protein
MEVINMIKMYKVNGAAGHRQRESFSPSYTFTTFDNITISVINSDITSTNNYTLVRLEGDKTEQQLEQELVAQIWEGIFENSAYGTVEEVTKEEFNQYVNEYVPTMKLVYDAKYFKKWKDSTIQKGLSEEISRNEAHDLIWEYYSNNGFDDDKIAKEIQDFDEYHVIDLGDYILSIEVEEE